MRELGYGDDDHPRHIFSSGRRCDNVVRMQDQSAGPILDDLLEFLGASPTPYHAVASALTRLEAAGFRTIRESEAWDALGPGRYAVVHGGTSVLAFVLPQMRAPAGGFRIVGAHTDSPNLRLKPNAEYKKEGYAQLGVEVYGGALLNSWLDRDLSVAGRVLVRGADGGIAQKLVRINRPLCRVAQLAIHLDRDVNDKLALNRQEHLAPLLGLDDANMSDLIAAEAGCSRTDIISSDLMLFDTVAPVVSGAKSEFLHSARLDNQAMCHAALASLIRAAPALERGENIAIAALFDHEEVGSESAFGAHSGFLPRALERMATAAGNAGDAYFRMLARSLCVSADMAHAVHPNYAERHEPRHKPALNGGPVIKVNAQQRYATSGATAALFSELGKSVDVPVQTYAHRTDLPCGTTIGPIVSTLLGIRTVDVGNPMLSMHSCREMAGTKDPELMARVLGAFYTCRDPE
jgi:aspartyl aminopeptidase